MRSGLRCAVTVMADFVSGREDALDRFGIALRRPAGDEERRGHVQVVEQPEDARHATSGP